MSTPKLPSSHTLSVNGEDKEVFMSFALLNRLAYLIGNPDNVALIMVDPETREACLKELLADRSKSGRVKTEVFVEDLDVEVDAVQGLLEFAAEHVLNFTLGAIEKSKALQFKNQARLLNLTSIPNGQAS